MEGTIGIITDSRDDCQDLNLIFKIANLWNELLFQNFKVIWRESCAGHIYRPFTNTLAILNSIVSKGYYGMFRRQVLANLHPEHLIIAM